MRPNNTMGKTEYIFENVFWALISMIWYKNILYRSIPRCTLSISKIVLWGLLLLFVASGAALTLAFRRNGLSVFVNVITPYEVYSIIAFKKDLAVLGIVAVVLALLVSSGYLVLILTKTIQNKARKKQILRRRIRYGIHGTRIIIAFCMMAFIVPISINALFGDTMAFKTTAAEVPNSESEYTIAANIDTVSNLLQVKWDTLDINEKTNTLQTVANIEASYLGLPHELNVKIDTLRESTIAQYDDRTHTITVNITYLDSMPAEEMLDSICHESYHAYQHRLVDAYNSVDAEYRDLLTFYFVPIYEEEFQNYVDGEDDDLTYYFQMCEMKARDYAEESVIDYYNKIKIYTDSDD